MMIKKLMAVMAVTSMLLAAACGSSGTGSKPAETAGTEKEQVTLTWWNSVDDGAEANALEDLIQKFEQENPNVKIERSFVPFADIKNKLLTSSVADKLPDIVWLDNPDHQSFAAANILADITTEVQAWGEGSKYYEGPWSSTVYQGKNYGVPISSNNLALFYNADMLNEAGVKPPTNWDELKEAAKKLTKDGVYGIGVSANKDETAAFQFLPWLWQAGSDLNNFNSEGTIEAFQMWKELMDNGYMSREVITHKHSDTMLQFASKKVAMIVNGTWLLGGDIEKADFKWDIAPLPSYKQSATILGGFNWAITANTKHKAEAWDFIQFANKLDNLKGFVQSSGRLPSRTDLIQDDFWQKNKNMKIFADSMESAKSRAYGPNYPKISGAVRDSLHAVLTGTTSIEEAVKEADAKIKPLLP